MRMRTSCDGCGQSHNSTLGVTPFTPGRGEMAGSEMLVLPFAENTSVSMTAVRCDTCVYGRCRRVDRSIESLSRINSLSNLSFLPGAETASPGQAPGTVSDFFRQGQLIYWLSRAGAKCFHHRDNLNVAKSSTYY